MRHDNEIREALESGGTVLGARTNWFTPGAIEVYGELDLDFVWPDVEHGGASAADADHLVLTHLHHDHAANVDPFAGAEVLLQREELAAARDPLPHTARTYVDDHRETVEDADLALVDGGFRLFDGIELRLAPGHPRGMQAVVVETSEGPHAIVGDLVSCRRNLEPGVESVRDVDGERVAVTPVDWLYVPPGIHVDAGVCYESIDRLRERVGEDSVILSGHMPEVLDHDSYPVT